MNLWENIFSKVKESDEEQKRREYFERNRNKKIMASTTLPTKEEVKQEESEQ